MNIEAADEWKADIRGFDKTVWLTENIVICSQNWLFQGNLWCLKQMLLANC